MSSTPSSIRSGTPLDKLGDVRLHAKALLERDIDRWPGEPDPLYRLLEALETLPERLWSEPIVRG